MEAELIQQTVNVLRDGAAILKQSGGDAVVRESAKGLWDYIRTKFDRPSARTRLDDLASNPDDLENLRRVLELFQDTVADDELSAPELPEKIAKAEKLFAEHAGEEPSAGIRISGDDNIALQDIHSSQINISSNE